MVPEDIVSEIEDLMAEGYVSRDQREQVVGYAEDLVAELDKWRARAEAAEAALAARSEGAAAERLVAITAKEARALREAAPPGPWEWSVYRGRHPARLCTQRQYRSGEGWLLQIDEDRIGAGLADLIAAAPELADTVEALHAKAEAAEANAVSARAEGAMAERAAVLAELRDDLLGCEVLPERTEDYVRELIEEIAAGAHVRSMKGA